MGDSKTPARRETLSRDRVLEAALALVDREGGEAVSMRRLAEALGVEAMSLYHHVENKAAVLDGIFERVLAELPPAPPAKGFRSAMAERGRALRAVLRRHPNALAIFATRAFARPAFHPPSVRWI
jgi:AcrR family transcriptional regulator